MNKAPCPVCSREITVKVDGTLRQHNDPIRKSRVHTKICNGTGRKP